MGTLNASHWSVPIHNPSIIEEWKQQNGETSRDTMAYVSMLFFLQFKEYVIFAKWFEQKVLQWVRPICCAELLCLLACSDPVKIHFPPCGYMCLCLCQGTYAVMQKLNSNDFSHLFSAQMQPDLWMSNANKIIRYSTHWLTNCRQLASEGSFWWQMRFPG